MPVNKDFFLKFQKKYKALVKKTYPNAIKGNLSVYPVSPFIISIPKKTKQKIKKVVKILYHITRLKNYIHCIQTSETDLQNLPHCLRSGLLMSYDFHWNEEEENLHLIEVNTNSSSYLLSDLVDQVHGKKTQALSVLKKSFQEEWNLFIKKKSHANKPYAVPSCVVIADHQIKKQKRYIEFLMYRDWINSWGWPCQLHEISTLDWHPNKKWLITQNQKKVDMIYNRCTDFYLKNYLNIKKVFLNSQCCISPNPLEYLLLADKQRLCEWCNVDFLNQLNLKPSEQKLIKSILPFTGLISPLLFEQLWVKRKEFFFKPLRKHGGKDVYSGETLTKKTFNKLIQQLGVYQKNIPSGIVKSNRHNSDRKWKYNIRAYVYKDQVQHLTARVYQGQISNYRILGSGFASVVID